METEPPYFEIGSRERRMDMSHEAKFLQAVWHSAGIVLLWCIGINMLLASGFSAGWWWLFAAASAGWLIVNVRRPFIKASAIVRSWISLVAVTVLGGLAGQYISPALLLGIGVGLSTADILSFTKRGAWTSNAKAMANPELLPKLIVYGVSWKDRAPVPTKELGDFAFYSLMVSVLFYHFDASSAVAGSGFIYLGCAATWLIISFLYRKPDYKGHPATYLPFGLVAIYLFCYYPHRADRLLSQGNRHTLRTCPLSPAYGIG